MPSPPPAPVARRRSLRGQPRGHGAAAARRRRRVGCAAGAGRKLGERDAVEGRTSQTAQGARAVRPSGACRRAALRRSAFARAAPSLTATGAARTGGRQGAARRRARPGHLPGARGGARAAAAAASQGQGAARQPRAERQRVEHQRVGGTHAATRHWQLKARAVPPAQEVRLFVGCALGNVLRIRAPEVPYEDDDVLKARVRATAACAALAATLARALMTARDVCLRASRPVSRGRTCTASSWRASACWRSPPPAVASTAPRAC